MQVFLDNRQGIARHNTRHLNGEVSYTLAMNKYGDLLHHEFVTTMNGYTDKNNTKIGNSVTFMKPANIELPVNVDWRSEGAVTPSRTKEPVDHAGLSLPLALWRGNISAKLVITGSSRTRGAQLGEKQDTSKWLVTSEINAALPLRPAIL